MADRSPNNDRNPMQTINLHKRMKIENEKESMDELEKLEMNDESMRKYLAFFKAAFRRHEENLASAMSFMARVDEFREEEYVLFHSNMITSMVRLPIDKLRIMFKTTQDLQDFDCCAEQPAYMIFEQLNTRELEQLHDDVKFDLDYISRAESTTGIMPIDWIHMT
ncbi:hypothetical protein LIER_13296 [Lithospermum erythrorhizon]|uniref:Uncharacterized protein n=1 Tax=Lithospermum erythrorhizon TaxID=34254 RepID=A0AAV3PVC9_LITER